jgi:hypothetical protein
VPLGVNAEAAANVLSDDRARLHRRRLERCGNLVVDSARDADPQRQRGDTSDHRVDDVTEHREPLRRRSGHGSPRRTERRS